MDIHAVLKSLYLGVDDHVLIGSGILGALGIRPIGDLDVTVSPETYARLSQDPRFTKTEAYGREVLVDDPLEIGTSWGVLGGQSFEDLKEKSVVVNKVRYITLEFLLAVKRSWVAQGGVIRQKDADDIALIEAYLAKQTD